MAFTLRLTASLLLILLISSHRVLGDSSSSSSEEDEGLSSAPLLPEDQDIPLTGVQPLAPMDPEISLPGAQPLAPLDQGTALTGAQPLPPVNQGAPVTGAQPIAPVDLFAAKLNLYNVISSGQPTAPEAEEEESVTTSPSFGMPQSVTEGAEEEEEEMEGGVGGAAEQTTKTPLPELHIPPVPAPLTPIQLPIPRVPLPPSPVAQGPLPPYTPPVQSAPGIITISSPQVQVSNPGISRPIAPLYPMAPMMPSAHVPQTPHPDESDLYCLLSTGQCLPSNSLCNGVRLESFCSGLTRVCCIPLDSKRAFGI